ncbi:MAG: hypothetical protein OXE53_08975 [Deltaproteobacteria bacterium]|nr:hypothetical protein [Deltaproteobacteria bacterium]
MKQADSETLKALKDKAETDPMKAVNDLLELVLNLQSGPRRSGASAEAQGA